MGNELEISNDEGIDGYSMNKIHYHETYEIYILEKGSRNYIVENKLIKLSERDVIFIKPYEMHTTGGGGYKRILISFGEEYIDSFFTENSKKILLECFEKKKIHISRSECERIIALKDRLLRNKLDFIAFLQIMAIFADALKIEVIGEYSQKNKMIADIMDYIGNHFDMISGLDEIADKFFITKYYLCRLFKENTGISVIKYIQILKIRCACEMLLDTTESVCKIASENGFASSMYFCKTFKAITGMTPSEYRKGRRLSAE